MPRKISAIEVRTPAARRMAARVARGQSSRTLENPQQSQARLQSDRLRHRVQRASETSQQSQTRQEADRLRHFRQRASTWADMLNTAFHYNPALNYEQFTFLQIGHMDKQCIHCTAFKYNGERPGMCCCSAGKVRIPDLLEPPEALRTLLDWSFPHSAEFMQRVRHYNNAFQMTSFGCCSRIVLPGYIPTFKVQGQVYHRIGSVLPPLNSDSRQLQPAFLQVFFIGDSSAEVATRHRNFPITKPHNVSILQYMLHRHNPYVHLFKASIEKMLSPDYKLVIKADKAPPGHHPRTFNTPTINEVAIVIVQENCDRRDIVLSKRGSGVQRINEFHRSYDALQYPLVFWNGQDGYHFHIPQLIDGVPSAHKSVSCMYFYASLIMIRSRNPGITNCLMAFGVLTHQILVDIYAKVESERLHYVSAHQAQLRVTEYINLMLFALTGVMPLLEDKLFFLLPLWAVQGTCMSMPRIAWLTTDLDQKMLDHMMVADAEEDTLNCEIEEAEHYSDTFITLERKSMQSNTRARELIESYPQTAENYAKTVQALKQRYGQKDLLVEIYVRELLKLMMANVKTPPDERQSVAKLNDKLETQLRSLESLGVDTKENTAWLFSMIESCLPEDVLVAWHRSPLNNCDELKNSNSNSSSRLNNLLDFLRREVEGEERRLLARRGFEGSSPKEKLRNKFKQNSNIPTAAGVFSANDIYGSLLSGRVKQLENELTAIETHLGWTICGPSPKKDEQTDYSSLVVISMHSRNMSVDYLWDLETIGAKDPRENLTKVEEDKIVHQHFLNTVHQLEDGRFCVGLPWLWNQEGIPSNRHIAERRLFNTTRKLMAKCIFSEYDTVFQEWLAEGVIEKVSPEDLSRKCHYLPHHPVVKVNSNTTKIRPVFDASCKDKGNLSLNDCLASGPNVIEQIPAILLKFREKAIGVIADIRKAFLQIEVKEEYRDYLRFLWWKNNHQIQVFRHKRVVFGVTCSPYLLGAVILHHLKGVSSEFGALPQKLMECFYIDNCVTSVDTEAELVDLVENSTEIFAKAKMDLRMWQFGPIHRVKEVHSRLPPCVDIKRKWAMGLEPIGSFTYFVMLAKVHMQQQLFYVVPENKGVSVQLLMAKSRLGPLKKTTIPRMELLACMLGVRLSRYITESLNLAAEPVYYWTDSTTALSWIKTNRQWGTFVNNRVKEICKTSGPKKWFYVPGGLNPADLPSRGCSVLQLKRTRWWEGPEWLKQPQDHWPKQLFHSDRSLVNLEIDRQVLVTTHVRTEVTPWFERFSNFTKIVRINAWIRRFIRNTQKLSPSGMHSLQLSELEDAEKGIWKTVQQQVFSSRGDSINGLMIIRDDFGLTRIKSKLIKRDDEYSFRYPILLPTKYHVVTCLIREFHLRHCHAGVQILSAKLREIYWILNFRRSIRSVVSQCAKCRRFSSKPVKTTPIHLPLDRVRDATAFEILGVDRAGPLYLKNKTKAWIVLFTCAVFRAMHLELVTSLSTEAFIQALRRFIARRGRPTVIYSDNGNNFVGANNALKALNWKKIVLDQNLHKISWKFIPPTAAWWGGWWERLIRSIKDLLVRILGQSSVYYEEMSTILCDAEAIINSRPLTYIHEDFDSLIPLSPSMFLHDSKYGDVFGKPQCWCYTIEWQKRGLPHAHILLWLKENIRPNQIDSIICAEIPNEEVDASLFRTVTKNMIHGPCGHGYPNPVCMERGRCQKKYPRLLLAETQTDRDGYPLYRRRRPEEGGFSFVKRMKVFTIENGVQVVRMTNVNIDNRRHPMIQHLSVHLENGQRVYFTSANAALQAHRSPKTTLTEYFALCQRDNFEKTLLYVEVPVYYIWSASKSWQPRKQGTRIADQVAFASDAIGRFFTVHPNFEECFYLRMLLNSVRGATSFAALRTINGVLCQTYKEPCLHLGLLENDQQWHHCIQEAVLSESPLKIRELFAIILTCCHPTNPQDIWAQFKEPMSADILNLARQQANDGLLLLTYEMSNQALILLEQKVLQMTGFHLTKFGMRSPQRNVTHRTSHELLRETSYDLSRCAIGVRTPAARRMAARAARGQSSRTLKNPQQSQARLQGHSLKIAGIDLEQPCFSHGQLCLRLEASALNGYLERWSFRSTKGVEDELPDLSCELEQVLGPSGDVCMEELSADDLIHVLGSSQDVCMPDKLSHLSPLDIEQVLGIPEQGGLDNAITVDDLTLSRILEAEFHFSSLEEKLDIFEADVFSLEEKLDSFEADIIDILQQALQRHKTIRFFLQTEEELIKTNDAS
ncbi:hypothetical protein LAZ67_2005619, partial [Cordylochernes scorpioides]